MYSPQEFKTSQVERPKERLRGVQGSSGYARSFVEQQDGEGRRAVLMERVLHRGRNEDFRKSEPTRSYFWGIRARWFLASARSWPHELDRSRWAW